MKPIVLTLLVGFSTGFIGCFLGIELCPDDQRLGKLKLTNPGFSPYRGNETLTFVDQAGNQLKLTNFEYSTLSTEQRLTVSTPCYKSDFNKQQIYYDIPRIFISYRQSQSDYINTIVYSFGIQDVRVDQAGGDTLLVESLSIGNNFSKPSTGLQILVSDRDNLTRFDPVKGLYPNLIKYRIIADTLLNGRPYQQVYCSKESPSLFFNQRYGILAFKGQQEQWWHRVP